MRFLLSSPARAQHSISVTAAEARSKHNDRLLPAKREMTSRHVSPACDGREIDL